MHAAYKRQGHPSPLHRILEAIGTDWRVLELVENDLFTTSLLKRVFGVENSTEDKIEGHVLIRQIFGLNFSEWIGRVYEV